MQNFKNHLKANQWWDCKIAPLAAVAYYLFAQSQPLISVQTALLNLAIFAVGCIGIAGFGHFLNDLLDVREDRITGARNLAAGSSRGRVVAICVLLLLFAWLPWFYLPTGKLAFSFIALEFLLFTAYSVPPLRLKERGIAGVITDAVYAHVLPLLVTWLTFSHLTRVPTSLWFGMLLGAWGLMMGVRNILHHQMYYAASDSKANTRTFAIMYGPEKIPRLVCFWLLPLEIILWLLILVVFTIKIPLLGLGFVLFLLWILLRNRLHPYLPPFVPELSRLNRLMTFYGIFVLNRFYETCLPLLVLIHLVLRSPSYWILVAAHLLVFKNFFVALLQDLWRMIHPPQFTLKKL